MSGGKGGSQTVETKIPDYVQDASRDNIDAAKRIAQMGYVPYYGPDVAAATPQMTASWQGANDAAGAFGMPQAEISVPEAQDFGGGVMGYSSAPMYEAALQELKRRRPDQYQAMNSVFGQQAGGMQPNAPRPTQPTMQPVVPYTPPRGTFAGNPNLGWTSGDR